MYRDLSQVYAQLIKLQRKMVSKIIWNFEARKIVQICLFAQTVMLSYVF